jgi:competence CoiA-like predicted nuclease
MLVSLHKNSGERVKAISYDTAHAIRSKFPLGELVCPFCDQKVFVRERKGFVLHFVHSYPCTTNMERHPESPEHEQGKYELARFLNQQIKDDINQYAKIEVEYPLTECGEHGRIADVALVYDNGNLLICECQLSKITSNELEKRTLDYYTIGADVLWFLGKEADTEENQKWLRTMFGSVGRLDFVYTSSAD